jgi:hypothetical protein
MSQSQNGREVDAIVRSAVVRLFGEDAIDSVEVRRAEDEAGQPALSVTIFLTEPRRRMSGSNLLDTIAEIGSALREVGDDRFPYVTFLAPGYEHAEDTRPAA